MQIVEEGTRKPKVIEKAQFRTRREWEASARYKEIIKEQGGKK